MLARIILRRTEVLLIVLRVHLVGIMLSMSLGLELVNLVHALCLRESVNLAANEAGNHLLGEGVADGFAWSVSQIKNTRSDW